MTEEIHELVADAFAHVVDMLVGGGGGGGLAGLTAEEADYRGELREQLAAVTRAQVRTGSLCVGPSFVVSTLWGEGRFFFLWVF